MDTDLALAFRLADVADAETCGRWHPEGVAATAKSDGSPVTDADVAAEAAVLAELRVHRPGDALLGEEVGAHPGTTGRRWIVDGIDGTSFYAAGRSTWGTLLALEVGGEIVLGLASSPVQDLRWWAVRGGGAHRGSADGSVAAAPLQVASSRELAPDRVATLPGYTSLGPGRQELIRGVAGGPTGNHAWSHALRIADGELDLCVWFGGDVWDHAAPSIIVEEAGGRFSDHAGGRRLDTRRAIYSSGPAHDRVLAALAAD